MASILSENPIVYALSKQRARIVEKYTERQLWDMYGCEETHKKGEEYLVAYHFPLILHQIKKLKFQKIDNALVFSNALYEMVNAIAKFSPNKGKFSSYYLTYYFFTKVIPMTLNANNVIALNLTNYKLALRIDRLKAEKWSDDEIIKKLKLSKNRYHAITNLPVCTLTDSFNFDKD